MEEHVLLYESTVMKKQQRKKRLENLFSRYFGQSSRPSSGDLMKKRRVVTICSMKNGYSWTYDTSV